MNREEIIALFMVNAAKVAAEPIRVGTDEELRTTVAEIIAASDSVFCPSVTDKEKALELAPDKRVADYASAAVCIDEVFAAVAETGSLVCSSQGGTPVQAGLLCSHHVALVAADNIFETLDDVFASFHDAPPTNITLETGPSRTADIELTLTIGVHGPGRLTIVIY